MVSNLGWLFDWMGRKGAFWEDSWATLRVPISLPLVAGSLEPHWPLPLVRFSGSNPTPKRQDFQPAARVQSTDKNECSFLPAGRVTTSPKSCRVQLIKFFCYVTNNYESTLVLKLNFIRITQNLHDSAPYFGSCLMFMGTGQCKSCVTLEMEAVKKNLRNLIFCTSKV